MRRILFVDDEPQILESLRDALRRQRHAWDMVFCQGGDAALAAMTTSEFDVIVADMRMPGMDGAELLQRVKERHPATVRIVLSGQADRDLVLRMLPVSQQFLSKPCPTDTLRVVVERACHLRDVLASASVRALVGDIDALASAPATYSALTDALGRGGVGVLDVSAIVERDPALSAKLLQIANSAYFGFAHTVTTAQAAVNYLGVELIKALSLLAGIFASAAPDVGSLDDLQRTALLVGTVARRIVSDRSRRDDAFTAGVLHAVGTLILATRAPAACAQIAAESRVAGRPRHDVEREHFGTSHAGIGAVLLGSWGLPYPIVQAVAFHEDPRAGGCEEDPVTVAVHVAVGFVAAALASAKSADAVLDRSLPAIAAHPERFATWWQTTLDIVASSAAR